MDIVVEPLEPNGASWSNHVGGAPPAALVVAAVAVMLRRGRPRRRRDQERSSVSRPHATTLLDDQGLTSWSACRRAPASLIGGVDMLAQAVVVVGGRSATSTLKPAPATRTPRRWWHAHRSSSAPAR